MCQYYKFGPAVMSLRDFWNGVEWNFLSWKLDPYRISPAEKTKADIIISKSNDAFTEKTLNLLYKEKDGFYDRQVLSSSDGNMIMQLVLRNSGEALLRYRISKDFSDVTVLQDTTQSVGHAAFAFLSRTAIYAMLSRDVISFHGVLMENNGKGVIISAPSGTGKTTHARLWRDTRNALIINGDNACCYEKEGRFTGFGIPWSGTSGESINREVPIKALVILEQSEENRAERLGVFDAFGALLPVLHCPTWDIRYSEMALDLLDGFLKKVPVIHLYCRPDEEAVKVLERALEELN